MFAYFICYIVFDKKLDINKFTFDIYFYKANVKDLNNMENKILILKLYDIVGYPFLCYFTIKEYKIQ